jgi:small GTP-binding protein
MGCCGSRQVSGANPIVISIFGLDGAGKTCVLRALSNEFDFECVPTIGLGQKTLLYDDLQVTFYDLGGNSKFRSVWQRFYAELWGFVWVIDSSDENRFAESIQVLESVRSHKMMADKPFVVLANKQDLAGAVNAADLRSKCNLGEDVGIFETVVIEVKDGKCSEAVTTAVSDLLDRIVLKYSTLEGQTRRDMEEQSEIDKREREEKERRIEERKRLEALGPAA